MFYIDTRRQEAEEGRKVAHKWQTERRALLREVLDAHDEGYSRDHVGYAQDMGREVPAWLGFDPAKPDTLALSLRDIRRAGHQRIAWGVLIASTLLFAIFYPILTAAPLAGADSFMTWAWISGWR